MGISGEFKTFGGIFEVWVNLRVRTGIVQFNVLEGVNLGVEDY